MTNSVDRLLLIRHATPIRRPDVPSAHWPLSDQGRADARRLGELLDLPRSYFVASDEPKAGATIRELAGDCAVITDARLGEVRRPYVESDYQTMARGYLEGTIPDGWEPRHEVVERFAAAIAEHAGRSMPEGLPLVIGSHGLAMTLWLSGRVDLRPDIATFWQSLRMPDAIIVDLQSGTATRSITTGQDRP